METLVTVLARLLMVLAALGGIVFLLWLLGEYGSASSASARAMARHPEPLASWTRAACVVLDGAQLWLDRGIDDARLVLAHHVDNDDRESWTGHVAQLIAGRDEGLDAWSGLRAISVLLAGARVGYTTEALAWEAVRAIAVELTRSHRSFRHVALSYAAAHRRHYDRPLDGSWDDDALTRGLRYADGLEYLGWYGIEFRCVVSTPCGTTIPNIEGLRRWLADGAPAAKPYVPPPPPIPRRTCTYCHTTSRDGRMQCKECGAAMRQAG